MEEQEVKTVKLSVNRALIRKLFKPWRTKGSYAQSVLDRFAQDRTTKENQRG